MAVIGEFDGFHLAHEAACLAHELAMTLVAAIVDRGGDEPAITSVARRCEPTDAPSGASLGHEGRPPPPHLDLGERDVRFGGQIEASAVEQPLDRCQRG